MKKQILILMISGVAVTTFGQDVSGGSNAQKSSSGTETLINKNGHVILPEKGDIAIGVDAIPFLRYIFNPNADNNSIRGNTLYGKYYLKDNIAIRARLRIGSNTNTTNVQIKKDLVNSNIPDSYVNDKSIKTTNQSLVGVGVEYRRGKNRLQGYYGGELGVSWGNASERMSYGNKLSQFNVSPTSTNFTGLNTNSDRAILRNTNNMIGFGLRAFGGAEYFVAPKISIGVELGWGVQVTNHTNNETTYERYTLEYEEYTIEDGNISTVSLDTDNFNGALNVFFHF